ncbi:hypothetical protein N7492_004078 [Penicillium capsulatum]|uniref:Zn(2)-C6 fungal-type domain-containing protein n=1 Tax=Penicillium capsulatum TaxID=69766 RepID=A0A9W9IKN3_9EURO|nr:hypothetical protein N7492_004078 [Penicillium capsulatum]KAJ6121349.1 hypothetical protein N7512_003814 [Penicillium capsulatum]
MHNPRDSVGHTSPESIPSIPSNPSSVGPSWASISPDFPVPPQSSTYAGQSSYFPPSATAEAASSIPGGNRVPIPRLNAPANHRHKRRSERACESCRQRKVKCDGTRPVCGQCVYYKATCSYEPKKRIRDQNQLAFLRQRVDQYENLLRSLEGESDPPVARRIRKALKVSIDEMDASWKTPRGKSGKPPADDHGDRSDSESSLGSLEDLDLVDEDINRNESTRAAGFFGKNSEVSWMHRLGSDVEKSSSQEPTAATTPLVSPQQEIRPSAFPTPKLAGDISLADMNYHLDDLPIPAVENTDSFGLPPRELADKYFNVYMTFVHPTFGVVRKTMFTAQYLKFFTQPESQPHRKWLAILNIIFAIGCRYCRLIEPGNTTQQEDLVFLTRARHLGLNEGVLFDHTDLQQVQLEFLFAVYLLCLGQVNRASKFSNMALHSAISLGINLRLVNDRIDDASKEARGRLWWSIYCLEHLLTSMNGRTSRVGEGLCSVSMPIPAEEESFEQPEIRRFFEDSTLRRSRLCPTLFESSMQRQGGLAWISEFEPCPSFFFYCLVDLSLMTQAVLNNIYSIEGIRQGPSQMEYQLQKYGLRLDRWLHKIPTCYRFTLPDTTPWHIDHATLDDQSDPFTRERVSLALNYYSARITLCRPCLTQTHTTPLANPSTPHDLSSRAKLRAAIATDCLQAACSLTSILPESADLTWLARVAPYWSILHHLMQATTALLLSISYCSFVHPPGATPPLYQPQSPTAPGTPNPPDSSYGQYPPLLNADLNTAIAQTEKALSWIHTMATVDPASRRAFGMCEKVIRHIAPELRIDLRDWPSTDTLAGGESREDFSMDSLEELLDFAGNVSF